MTQRVRFSLDTTLAPYCSDTSSQVRHGILDGDTIHETATMYTDALGAQHPRSEVRLLPPVSPSKIVCVGRNYAAHARELGNEAPSEPLLFFKPPSSLLADGDNIVYPAASERVDFEGELGVVIGTRARRVSRADALSYVYGYTIVNDVTARDLQKKDGQWTRGKGFDTFCPVGPWLVPAEQVAFESLHIRTYLDDQLQQEGSPAEMLFPLDVIIEYVTRCMTLEPGDLIATGTPPGVGPMRPGSEVRVEIAGLGVLRNRIIAEETTP